MFFKNIYTNYKELKAEHDYYARENFLKEERIRKLKSQVKELEEENNNLKEQLEQKEGEEDGRKITRAKHNSGNKSSGRTRSKQTNEI